MGRLKWNTYILIILLWNVYVYLYSSIPFKITFALYLSKLIRSLKSNMNICTKWNYTEFDHLLDISFNKIYNKVMEEVNLYLMYTTKIINSSFYALEVVICN